MNVGIEPSRTKPASGLWMLEETDPNSASYRKKFGFSLDAFPPQMRQAVGNYAWTSYVTKAESARTTATKCRNLRYFADYLSQEGIDDLRSLTPQTVDGFRPYLASAGSYRTGKRLSYRSQYSIFKDLRAVIGWLQVNDPGSVAQTSLFEGAEYIGINDAKNVGFLPDGVIRQVNAALESEGNLMLKNAILILEGTGMRASELENLKVDCVRKHPVNGHMIEWFDLKNGKQRKPIPASPRCVAAVKEIISITEGIRGELPEEERGFLMVFKDPHRSFACKRIRSHLLRTWLRKFAERHGIVDADGDIANLTAHAFRRTLATDMVSKGVDIVVVKEVMGHAFTSTTKQYYAKVKDPEMAEAFSKMRPAGLDQAALTGEERSWLAANKDGRALLSDGYCAKPFAEGEMCRRLEESGQCLTCSRFVTTPEFLGAHRRRLEGLKADIANGSAYGEHYRQHLQATIDLIEALVARLEAM